MTPPIAGLPPRRLDQQYNPPNPPGPVGGAASILRAREVIVNGPFGGVFIYDNAGNLRLAEVGQTTTDPEQGITCQQGTSTFNGHGAVLSLNSTAPGSYGFFVYLDSGSSTQGALQNVDSPINGTEPVTGASFKQGLTAFNTLTGASTRMTPNADIHLSAVPFTSDGGISAHIEAGFPACFSQMSSPAQASLGNLLLMLFGEKTTGLQGPFALLGQGNNNYAINKCWYEPGFSTDDGAALNALFALGINVIDCLPGTYSFSTTVLGHENQYIFGPGKGAATVNLAVVGIAAFKWTNSGGTSTYPGTAGGGGPFGFTIKGPGAANNPSDGSIGVQMGNIPHLGCDVRVEKCQWGILLSNDNFFTEQGRFTVNTFRCTNPAVMQCAAAGGSSRTGSFDRSQLTVYHDDWLDGNFGHGGVQLLAGAQAAEGFVRQYGNFGGTGQANVYGLYISGQVPGGLSVSNFSQVDAPELVHGLEYDGTGTKPGTIFTDTNTFVQFATGVLRYSNFGPGLLNGLRFGFQGPINGDAVLLSAGYAQDTVTPFPATFTGSFNLTPAGSDGLMFLESNMGVPAGFVLSTGQQLSHALPAQYQPINTRMFALSWSDPTAGTQTLIACSLSPAGIVSYQGAATLTMGAAPGFLYGQTIYSAGF